MEKSGRVICYLLNKTSLELEVLRLAIVALMVGHERHLPHVRPAVWQHLHDLVELGAERLSSISELFVQDPL